MQELEAVPDVGIKVPFRSLIFGYGVIFNVKQPARTNSLGKVSLKT